MKYILWLILALAFMCLIASFITKEIAFLYAYAAFSYLSLCFVTALCAGWLRRWW